MPESVVTSRRQDNETGWLTVEVVFAKQAEQILVTLKLAEGSTVEDAVNASGLLKRFPEIDLSVNKVGIFGNACSLESTLKQNDRVEIYRPLLRDPKETRRLRAAKKSVSWH